MITIPTEKDFEVLQAYHNSNPDLETSLPTGLPEITLAIKRNNKLVGSITLFNITANFAEWGISVFDKKGLPLVFSSSYEVFKEAFNQGLEKIFCRIFRDNDHALRQAIRAGFKVEGYVAKDNREVVVLSMAKEYFIECYERGGKHGARSTAVR